MIRKYDYIWKSDRFPVNTKKQTAYDNDKYNDSDDNDVENDNNSGE